MFIRLLSSLLTITVLLVQVHAFKDGLQRGSWYVVIVLGLSQLEVSTFSLDSWAKGDGKVKALIGSR